MSEAIKLFQYNTLSALMAGLYGGTLTIGELLEHGDLGIGTLDSIDGELIILDGKAYQAIGSNGKPEIVEVSDDVKVPYAAVVPHQAEVIFKQRFEMTDAELKKRIESYYDGVNLFRSIKIKGTFSNMHVRKSPLNFNRTEQVHTIIIRFDTFFQLCICHFKTLFENHFSLMRNNCSVRNFDIIRNLNNFRFPV